MCGGSASTNAVAAPIPRLAPVIRATRTIVLTREDRQRIDDAARKGAASGELYEDMSAVNH
jgi:hypothetical protein